MGHTVARASNMKFLRDFETVVQMLHPGLQGKVKKKCVGYNSLQTLSKLQPRYEQRFCWCAFHIILSTKNPSCQIP